MPAPYPPNRLGTNTRSSACRGICEFGRSKAWLESLRSLAALVIPLFLFAMQHDALATWHAHESHCCSDWIRDHWDSASGIWEIARNSGAASPAATTSSRSQCGLLRRPRICQTLPSLGSRRPSSTSWAMRSTKTDSLRRTQADGRGM